MIKVGITGSIASGKTTVARMFAGKKYPLFDADNEVRKIYKTNFFKNKVRKKFNLTNTKNIKKKMKKVISQNEKNLKKLEKIIHPLVRKSLRNFVKKNKNKEILIFEIPLLIESRLMRDFTKVVFVNSKKKIRLKRYLKKGKNKKTFDLLNKRQLSPVKKIKFSDYVINNNNSLEFLKKNVKIIKNNL